MLEHLFPASYEKIENDSLSMHTYVIVPNWRMIIYADNLCSIQIDSVLWSTVKDGARRVLNECQKMLYSEIWQCPLEMNLVRRIFVPLDQRSENAPRTLVFRLLINGEQRL